MDLFYLAISATFVNNILLAQYLGNCPFLGVSKRIETAAGMAAAIIFVTILSAVFTWAVLVYMLRPYGLEFLQTLTFILIIASLVQFVEIILKKKSKVLYDALGVYLALITTNCAVLGVVLLVARKELAFIEMLVFSSTSAVGYALALLLFAGHRERLQISAIPRSMQGTAIALVTAGIMSLAFIGFRGMAN
ncbi:electron transport complex protein RnfA [Desulfofustis limnaeus]|jgi:electron transport complex protein RnfA|uniref:Ion-translocating oxidoreductase complex subunit A n=1 Tax=Desulfofustis limnaeus TaxID=2740163 RepID=A0ABN6M8X3_9BACT|nr:RnfABCDGE type electron transport complex subunit A [Desulfofustis limnaeus]MDX9894926.1 RnfABCDGE type electron transport complex subunit A [Desulfofustis sp.]BDD89296.1 electron transport complex subunit A [Desulfofustis limnaeus]